MSFSFNGNTPRKIIFNNQDVKKLIFNNNIVWQKSGLPSEYEELEYIESTGTQYIDTGISPDINTQVDYKVRLKAGASNYTVLIGARVGSENTTRFFPIAYQEPNGTFKTTLGNKQNIIPINFNIDYEGSFQPQNEVSIINGTSYSLAGNNFTKTDNYNMYLFATLGFSGNLYQAKGVMYYCKIYDNDVLVRNFIPCYRKSDNVAGLYDKVTNTFYINSGTGEFIKGYK